MQEPLAVLLVRDMLALDRRAAGAAALAKADLCALDFLSCAFAGLQLPWARQAVAAAAPWPVARGALVIGTRLRVPPGEAGFINSVMAASASRTDMHPAITSHVAPIVFPAALACAAITPVSGAAFAAAIVAGYEAEARLGAVLVSEPFKRKFRATSLLGSAGAAIVAAKLLSLDEQQAVHALSISVNAAAGLMEWGHSGEVDLFWQPGNAVRAALSAALLARAGASASATVLEGPGGLFAAFGGLDRTERLRASPDGLREIERVDFKPVPACVFVQAAAFAAQDAVRRHGAFDIEGIAAIRVRTFGAALQYPGCDNPGPIHAVQPARMSLQHTVASVIARAQLGDRNFSELDHAPTRQLTAQVQLEEAAEFSSAFPARQGAEVQVMLKNGSRACGRVDEVAPVDASRVRDRFLESAAPVLGAARALDIAAACARLSQAESLQPLLDLLQAD